MYLVVITRKKWLNTILVLFMSFLLLFGLIQLILLLSPQTEITLEQRISILFPASTQMSSIYMTSPNMPAIQADSIIGKKWNTQKIEQLNMSEISFQYPETIRLDEIRNMGQEITIHINYNHNNGKMCGFFQVWKLNRPLGEFLNTSKKYTSMTFKSFSESDFNVKELDGVLWEYVFLGKTQDIKGIEVFLENGSEMYRFSMFMPYEDYKPVYKKVFLRMVRSLKVMGKNGSELSYVTL
jgi:hypothetical protein